MTLNLSSILLGLALVVSLSLLGKAGCDRQELMSANDKLNKELMQADLEKGRALTEFGDAQSHISQLKKEIADEIKEREGVVTRYGELELEYKLLKKRVKAQQVKVVREPNRVIEVPVELKLTPDKFFTSSNDSKLFLITELSGEYEDERLQLKTRVDLNQASNILFEHEYSLKLSFEIQLVESHLPSGAINHYVSAWELEEGKRTNQLQVNKFVMIVEKPQDKQFFWLALHVDIGMLVGMQLPVPAPLFGGSLGLSLSGYGKTVNDLDWRFFRLSFDLAGSSPGVGFTPALWNMGKYIPLLSNIWIAPHVTYLPPEGWAVTLFIGAML